jgi:hypothetical protein
MVVANVARPSRGSDPRGEMMLEPDEVSAMLRPKQLGWAPVPAESTELSASVADRKAA